MRNWLQIWALGGLKLARNGEPVTGLASRKADALVLYLAHTGRPHTREELATLLWHDYPAERALNNLSVLLTSVRKQLGDYVSTTRQTVAFNLQRPHWLDASALEEKLRSALATAQAEELLPHQTVAGLEEALELYRGDFLAGFHVPHARGFEEWTLLERERLRHQVINALDSMVASYLARGEHRAGLLAAKRLLTLDPLREQVHRQLMRLLVRSDQRHEAMRQYEACRRILSEELGAEPAEETTMLYERIQAVKTGQRHNLPARLTPFIGRTTELAQIAELLARPSCRLLTLFGAGGMGKTRLALESAGAQVGRHLHGVFLVPLAAADTAESLPAAIADALELPLSGREEPKIQLADYLRDRELLLVLDGFEHLIPAAELLSDILRSAPEVTLLVTSRERLKLQSEWVYEVPGMAVPAAEDVPSLDAYESLQLFEQSARRVRTTTGQRSGHLPSVVTICQKVEGMPLAIELAASWTKVLSFGEISREIERGMDFLRTVSPDMPERHRSLRAVCDHSWRLLSPEEGGVYARLSVFRGGFDRRAALDVARASLSSLSALVDKSLLRAEPVKEGEATSRYGMHDLLHQYAAERLALAPGEPEETRKRHGQYYARFLEHQESLLLGLQPLPALRLVRWDLGNVRAAWTWASATGRVRELNQMIDSLHRFLWMRDRYQEGVELFTSAADRLVQGSNDADPEARRVIGKLLGRQAWFCIRAGQLATARAASERSLQWLDGLNSWRDTAFSLHTLGRALHLMGEYQEADRCYGESLALSKANDDRPGIAACLSSWLRLHLVRGRFVAAEACLAESTASYGQLGDRWSLALNRHDAGIFGMRTGAYGDAQVAFSEGLEIFRELESRREVAACLNNMGVMAQRQGNFRDARRYYREALGVFREVSDQRAIASGEHNLGEVAEFDGNYIEAERRHRASLAISREIGDQPRVASSLGALGYAALGQGDYDKAAHYFYEALQRAWDTRSKAVVLDILIGMATLRAKSEDLQRAVELLAIVLSHPATLPDARNNRAEPLLAELAAKLPEDLAAAAIERGRSQTLDAAVKELLATRA